MLFASPKKYFTENICWVPLFSIGTVSLLVWGQIYIKTWGCSHNNSDGEYMAGQLAAYGYKITGNFVIMIIIIIMIMKKHLVIMTTF